MSITIIIGVITVALFIASVIFYPKISIRKRNIIIYPFIPLLGAIAMIIARSISIKEIMGKFLENTPVNPIKILVLFLSMTIFSLILERTGFFDYISSIVLKKAGKKQVKIFIFIYLIVSFLTIFTSNDIVILTFTPFICHFCRSAKINPIPYLIMEFIAANTWSLLFVIGNPTNIYIAGSFSIGFVDYFKVMAFPTMASGLVSLCVMLLIFRKALKKEICVEIETARITDKPLMIISLVHLILCVLMLAVSQYLNIEMWIVSLVCFMSVLICSITCQKIRGKGLGKVKLALLSMPTEIVPFIIGMFIVVLAMDNVGITREISDLLNETDELFSYGYLSFVFSNVLNNIPMSLFFSKIIEIEASIPKIFATIAGSNLGAFLTPVGALAGIMWMNLLKSNDVKLNTLSFIKYGLVIGLPSMSVLLLVLKVIC